MALFDQGPSMSLEEFRLLRELVNETCGIRFEEDAMYAMERRLRERLRVLGLGSFRAYYQRLRYHPEGQAELENAVDVLTTNETYFFREAYQLEAFERSILPELRERNAASKRVTVWSAGCSTGEEVYTIAMILLASGAFPGWDIRVFGSDISRRVIQHARRGVYGESSFRAMQPRYGRFFQEGPRGRVVANEVKSICHFGQLNLLDRERSALIGSADVIFCRNVLIYFDDRSRDRVVQTFHDRLAPGGYLLLGHSESLLHRATQFEIVHLDRDIVYRRPKRRTMFDDPEASPAEGGA